ncbi:hypothetical protein Smp_160800 [Schistosoma mansoni]|uniref:DUF3480 domain-containing protein n=1 Tax=Schistosoma mansoni TaxID=6183 RepID=G4VFV0_SCHMA|nr:hypothetical protein Smp_160800 [Schistosoma mansoni]|eukprot:XP_018651417.1 hypothetical protein Smp_160800 [Schistosoma mansoni]
MSADGVTESQELLAVGLNVNRYQVEGLIRLDLEIPPVCAETLQTLVEEFVPNLKELYDFSSILYGSQFLKKQA